MDEMKENLEKMPDLRRLLHLPAAGPYHHRDRERGGGETRVPGSGRVCGKNTAGVQRSPQRRRICREEKDSPYL